MFRAPTVYQAEASYHLHFLGEEPHVQKCWIACPQPYSWEARAGITAQVWLLNLPQTITPHYLIMMHYKSCLARQVYTHNLII